MSDALPTGWIRTALLNVGRWGSGGTPSRKDEKAYGGTIPWVKIGDLPDGPVLSAEETITEHGLKASAAKLLEPDTLLVAMYGSIGKLGITTARCATNQAIAFCIPHPGFQLRYLFYLLMNERHRLVAQGQGGTQLNISQTILKAHEVPIAPSHQQIRIVSKIDELFSEIEEGERALEHVQKLVERYRQSVLKAAVTGELTREWREKHKGQLESGEALLQRILKARRKEWERAESAAMRIKGKKPVNDNWKQRYREPKPPDASMLPQLPEGWVWASIDQLALDVTYGTSAKCNDDQSGVPVIRMGNINGGEIDTSELKYLPLRHPEFPALFLHEGDMLFNRTNSAELVGKSAVFKNTEGHWSFASYLIRVRFAVINADWVAHYINSVFGRTWISAVRNQQVGQANVNGSKLKALSVPLPPLLEMNESLDRVTQHISSATAAIQTNAEHVRLARALRQSILKCAFEGQLTARDPSDEPAAALLKRIAVERLPSNVAKKPSPRKRRAP